MADEKKIIVDDDWKEQARREKERLAAQAQSKPEAPMRGASVGGFMEIVNVLVMQAMAGLGLLAGRGGERIPPNLESAKHFIDLLQVLDEKTKGNLSPEEKAAMDSVLYEMRMTYVQLASASLPSAQGMPGMGAPGRGAPGTGGMGA